MGNRRRKLKNLLGVGLALIPGIVGAKSPKGELKEYLSALSEATPVNELDNPNFEYPTYGDYLQLAYKERTPEIFEAAQAYREAHPELIFAGVLKTEALTQNFPRQKAPEGEAANMESSPETIINEDGTVDVIEHRKINLNPKLGDSFAQSDRHEIIHASTQMNLENDQANLIFRMDRGMHTDIFNDLNDLWRKENPGKELPNLGISDTALMLSYPSTDVEIEPRLAALKSAAFVATQGELAIKTPQDTVRALKLFGFDLDEGVIAEIFEKANMPYPEEAMQQRPLRRSQLNFTVRNFLEINDLRNGINGTEGYRDVRFDTQKCPPPKEDGQPDLNADPISLPTLEVPMPAKEKMPRFYRNFLEAIIMKAPGVAMQPIEANYNFDTESLRPKPLEHGDSDGMMLG